MNLPHAAFFTACSTITPIINALAAHGATSYLVGGSVRDYILALATKDFDIEVHGISLEQLHTILSSFDTVIVCGKSFGVLKLAHHAIDWSLPRTDSAGRKPLVAINPHLGIDKALQRRDFTINAMAINLNTLCTHLALCTQQPNCVHEIPIIDPYNGQNDLANKILRAVDTTLFIEDPLRLFRGMQFIGRFNLTPDATLNTLCATMPLTDLSGKALAQERIVEEFKKLITQAVAPSQGLQWLITIGRLHELFGHIPSDWINNKQVTPQFIHALTMLDAAALRYQESSQRFAYLVAALLLTLVPAQLLYAATLATVKKILQPLIQDQTLIKTIATLIHFQPQALASIYTEHPTIACKKLAHTVAPLPLAMLGFFLQCTVDATTTTQFITYAHQANVYNYEEPALLTGADLLNIIPPGPQLGIVLEKVYLHQLEQSVTNVAQLQEYAQSLINPPPLHGT